MRSIFSRQIPSTSTPGSWIILSATPSTTSKKRKALDEPTTAAAPPTKKTAGSTQSREHRIENEIAGPSTSKDSPTLTEQALIPEKRLRRHETTIMSLLTANARSTPPSVSKSSLLWHVPTELLLLIASELDQESLRVLSQTCRRLLDVAATRYLENAGINGTIDTDWRMLSDKDCEMLLVWRRTDSFKMPKVIWFSGSHCTGDRQFRALSIFFDSLRGLEPVDRVYLCFYQGPAQASLALYSCLESILGSGCQGLHCYGGPYRGRRTTPNDPDTPCVNNLRALRIDSPLLFTHSLRNAPLQRLTLINTALTPDDWTELFASLILPHLTVLEVGAECPIPILVKFLLKHRVRNLRIAPRNHSMTVPFTAKLRPRLRAPVPSLAVLDGQAEVIKKLMRHIDVPGSLQHLTVRLCGLNNHRLLLQELLDCAENFAELEELRVMVGSENDEQTVYAVPDDERTCSARNLVLQPSRPTTNPNIIAYCAPWMRAFPQAQTLWLSECSSLSGDELLSLFRAFSPLEEDLCVNVLKALTEDSHDELDVK
ncbi:hypothetical protein HD554DRAFT_2041818 [Boletus coccyginus]|nr:hypothetical protein HD554DRAFT_2041818 [Boletus coccyginus]